MKEHMKLDDIKKLHQKKYRQEFGCYLVEGEHLIQELEKVVAHNSAFQGSKIIVSEKYRDWPTSLEKIIITEQQMAKLSDTQSPQGIIAVVPIIATSAAPQSESRVKSELEKTIYLFEVQDPGNLGTILRTLAWFGNFRCLLSPNSVDPYNSKVVRSSMGALFHVPLEIEVPLDILPERFSRIACLDMKGQSINSAEFSDFDCYFFGNEARGVPLENKILNSATAFTIPGSGAIESLNLASAVNMCIYQLGLRIAVE